MKKICYLVAYMMGTIGLGTEMNLDDDSSSIRSEEWEFYDIGAGGIEYKSIFDVQLKESLDDSDVESTEDDSSSIGSVN